MSVRKAVIPAAGFGTRFLPATKAVAKEMFPIVNVPALQYIVKEAADSGITDVLIVLGRNKKSIEDHFDISYELEDKLYKASKHETLKMLRDINKMCNIYYVRQDEMLGSAHAIELAKGFVQDEPFAVLYGDDLINYEECDLPTTKQLIDAYNKKQTTIVGVQQVDKSQVSKYGVIEPFEVDGKFIKMKRFVEKPKIEDAPSNYVSLGRFIFDSEIFKYIKKTSPSSNGELYITDSIELMSKNKDVFAYDFDGLRYDIGDHFGYVKANIDYALKMDSVNKDLLDYMRKLVK